MTDTPNETSSYVPVKTDDGESKTKRHVRRFSDSALVGEHDAGSVASSWASPTSPGRAYESTRQSVSPLRRTQPPQPQHPLASPTENNKSLQDQFLAGTLELLKMAGGATLSTTGKLVQPPLAVAQNVLIPALWSALLDYVNQVTPVRVKDWFRILSTSAHHLVLVIGSTTKGKLFRQQVRVVGDGIADCVSSDASRQAIMDGMAAWVKLAEALHTPETKIFLDHLSVLGCRLVDAAASGRNKQLLHDLSSAIWAGLELFADPSSTLAFAEVTAYLCFALEMEDAIYRQIPLPRERAAQRRQERNVYQKNTYTDVNMMQDANTTVEQVMLSSLGETMDEQGSFSSNIVMPASSAGDWLEGETEEMQDGLNWRERAGDDIDLQFLQERITKRAIGLESQRQDQRRRQPDVVDALLRAQEEQKQQTRRATGGGMEQSDRQTTSGSDIEEIIVTTVDENDDNTDYEEEARVTKNPQSAAASIKSKTRIDRLQYQTDKEQATAAASLENKDDDAVHEWLSETFTTDQPPVAAVDGESAPSRFYRRLDEIMDKKRTEAVVNVLNQQLGEQANVAGLSWFPKAAAAAGAGNERGQDTIRNRVAAIRTAARYQIGVGQQLMEMPQDKDTRRTFSYFTPVTGLVGIFWFAMGLYGCYAIVFGPIGGSMFGAKPSPMSGQQEIIVRIVREVIHVDANGKTLNTERYRPVTSDEEVDQLAACVANAMQ